jgi:hypothetical protein
MVDSLLLLLPGSGRQRNERRRVMRTPQFSGNDRGGCTVSQPEIYFNLVTDDTTLTRSWNLGCFVACVFRTTQCTGYAD